jgi:hypothetical protein
MLKHSVIFSRNGAHLVDKKDFWKKERDCPLLRFECFEHAKIFFICVKLWTCKLCSQWKIIPKFFLWKSKLYYDFLAIFQTYKNVILKNVHSIGWLLWQCFYLLTLIILFVIFLKIWKKNQRKNFVECSRTYIFWHGIFNVNW